MIKNIPFLKVFITFCIIVFNALTAVSSSSLPLYSQSCSHDKVLLMGAIQYPLELDKIPMLRIYCGGNKIKCETNNDNKKLTFAFTEYRQQSQFYILITEQIEFVTENNVVLYLKVPSDASYKLYALDRIRTDIQSKDKGPDNISASYRWIIKEEMQLAGNGRIPDNAIIICTDPAHVAELTGDLAGSDKATAYELPKLIMRSDLLQIVGSEEKLHEHADMLRLAAIDSDTIHSWRQNIQSTVNRKAKTIVALTT